MSLNLKSLAPGRAWIAAAAICLAAASSAQADLTLTVTQSGTQNNGTGTSAADPGTTFSRTFMPETLVGQSMSNSNSGNQTFSFMGYTLQYTVSTVGSSSNQSLTFSGTLTRGSADPTSNQFTFNLFSSNSANSSIFGTAGATATTAVISSMSSASTNATPPGTTAAVFSSADANSSSGNAPTTGSGVTAPFQSSITNTSNPFGLNFQSFNLQTSGTLNFGSTPTSGSLVFNSTAQVFAVPEPSSVIAGLMGLPCMGAALSFLRRRVTGAAITA